MTAINKIKLDKFIRLLILLMLDSLSLYLFIELVLSVTSGSFTLNNLVQFIFFLGLIPIIICIHLKNAQKNIVEKLKYLGVFSTSVYVVFISVTDFFIHGNVGIMYSILNLTFSILFGSIGIFMIVKLFSNESMSVKESTPTI